MKKILVTLAMENELKAFKKTISVITEGSFKQQTTEDEYYLKGIGIYEINLPNLVTHNERYFVALCGKAAQVHSQFRKVLDKVKPDFVINIGCVGSYEKFAKQFDVFVLANAASVIDRSEGEAGNLKLHTEPVYCRGYHEHITNDIELYNSPSLSLIRSISKKVTSVELKIDYLPKVISDQKYTVITDSVNHAPFEEHWAKNFQAKGFCCDQEAAFIGRICEDLEIPFIFLKGVSDFSANKKTADENGKYNQNFAVMFATMVFCELMLIKQKRGAREVTNILESEYLAEGTKVLVHQEDELLRHDQFLSQLITAKYIDRDKSAKVELRIPAQSTVESILLSNSRDIKSILVSGDYWSGRTLFCCLIYEYFLKLYPESKVFPLYINFAKHLKLSPERQDQIIEEIFESDLKYIEESDQVALILTRASIGKNQEIWSRVRSFAEKYRTRIRVICLGVEECEPDIFYKTQLEIGEWSYIYHVNAIEREQLAVDNARGDWLKGVLADKYESFTRLDPPIVHAEVIVALIRDIAIPDLKACRSWFSFVLLRADKYCLGYLGKPVSKKLYSKMGRLAFKMQYNDSLQDEKDADNLEEYRCQLEKQELEAFYGLGSFSKVYDALAVNYICSAINEFDPDCPKSIAKVECVFRLASSYDHMYNELFKGCINDTNYVQNSVDFVRKLTEIYKHIITEVIPRLENNHLEKSFYFNGLAHCCYLMGRVKNRNAVESAIAFLSLEQKLLEESESRVLQGSKSEEISREIAGEINTRSYRLYRRTIYISLMYLEREDVDQSYYERYLDKLFEDGIEDELNNIFHIEYYASTIHANKEPSETQIEKAVNKLWLQAKQKLDQTPSQLLTINVFTVFSILINASYSEKYDKEFKQRVKERALEYSYFLLERKDKCTSYRIRGLVRFVDFVFGSDVNPVEYFFWLLGRYKHIPRKGWVDRELGELHNIQQIESVASHTYSAQFLARLLINEEHIKSGVDKELVLKMLWAHDIPEAVVGDRVDKGNRERNQEVEVAYFLSCFGLLPKFSREITQIGRLVYQFEKGDTRSAFAAQQLDKLENYVQLINYGRKFNLLKNRFSYDYEFQKEYINGLTSPEPKPEKNEVDQELYESYKLFLKDLSSFDKPPFMFQAFHQLLGNIPQRLEGYKGSNLLKEFKFEELSRKIEEDCY